MRVAVIADSHFHEHKRFEECQRLHDWIFEDCSRRGVDLVLHAGDVFETKSSEKERLVAFSWFQRMASLAHVIVVRGNHDRVSELPALAKLEVQHSITVVEESAVVEAAGALVACVSWPRKAALLAAAGIESRADAECLVGDALRDVFRGLGDELAEHEGPKMLLMHAMVRGSATSSGQPLIGAEMEVGLEDLALARADAYFLGHIHKSQAWSIGEAPVIYPGDPRRTDFGEREAKGYVVAEWDDAGVFVGWEFVEVPATPMVAIEGEWSDEDSLCGIAIDLDDFERVRGAEVRLRYTTPHQFRVEARRHADELRGILVDHGAVLVQIEPRVLPEQRERAETIPTRATRAEQLDAYWKAKSFEPGERRPALVAKLARIEERHHAA